MERPDADALERRAFAAFAEAMPGPVLVVDADLRIVVANRATREILPRARAGAALVMALRAPDVLDAAQRVIAGGGAEETRWSERAPVERVFDVLVTPLAFGSGQAAVLSFTDLTEARRVERMRVEFIANVSHELRTPLASLLGFVETLQGAARDDPAVREKFLDIMVEQARRMARLIDDLLSLSRIERSEHVRPRDPVDLVEVVSHVLEGLRPLAEENATRMVCDLPASVVVPGDRDEMIRLAENLIENAIKYGGAGEVRITLTQTDDEACLSVRDFGPGIEAQHIPRLTERFYRVDATASRARGGTGLGLAIVKHIVTRHRGRLTIESRPGEGALFRVTLPRKAE